MTCPILPVGPVRVVYTTAWIASRYAHAGYRRNYAAEVVVRYRRVLPDLGPW